VSFGSLLDESRGEGEAVGFEEDEVRSVDSQEPDSDDRDFIVDDNDNNDERERIEHVRLHNKRARSPSPELGAPPRRRRLNPVTMEFEPDNLESVDLDGILSDSGELTAHVRDDEDPEEVAVPAPAALPEAPEDRMPRFPFMTLPFDDMDLYQLAAYLLDFRGN